MGGINVGAPAISTATDAFREESISTTLAKKTLLRGARPDYIWKIKRSFNITSACYSG